MHRFLRLPLALAAVAALSGCDMVVMNPAGDVARQQANLILWSTFLMLLIIVPVMALTVLFAWRYRATNRDAEYKPDWDHSTVLELVIWSAPLLIIIALGALTWVATHTLDPYRPLTRLAAGKPVPKDQRPLEIQVVSLDWKWLFIYPEQGVATVNELVLPVDRQVRFSLTSSTVMNTFYVPAMAGMIYTMPGMDTKLHAVINRPGRFEGVSANYSGAGFSGMKFWTHAVDDAGFERWVEQARQAPVRLTGEAYLALEKPSEKVAPMRFGSVEADLYRRALEMCVTPGKPCMSETMRHDGGHGGADHPVNDEAQDGAPAALEKAPGEYAPSPRTDEGGNVKDAPTRTGSGQPTRRETSHAITPRLPGATPIFARA